MTDIRLLKMVIRNFKGIKELEMQFDGKDMNILGDNGTGKTSVIDSFTWLLFGKDSLGRTDFGIKPTDSEGNIIHHLETEVFAVFEISGIERTFKKTLSEVWTRKRGAAEAKFTRNENNFYIDGVPKKKAEYTAAINELINEEVFKIITNPLYFNESVKWQDRRSVLLAICGEISDEDIINSDPLLYPLTALLQGKSVSDFKAITDSAMKQINSELDMIPVKINEAERAKPSEAKTVDYDRKAALEKEIEDLRIKKSNIENGLEVQREEQKIRELRMKRELVVHEVPPIDGSPIEDIKIHKQHLEELKKDKSDLTCRIEKMQREIADKQTARQGYSKKWDEIYEVKFTDSVCPTCHRELPEDEVEKKRSEFNLKKARALDEIERQNKQAEADIAELISGIGEVADKLSSTNGGISEIEAYISVKESELAAANEMQRKAIEEAQAEIDTDIAASEALIQQYKENNAEIIRQIDADIAALSKSLSDIDTAIASNALMERQDKRIAELREEQKRLAAEYTTAERNLYLAEQFIVKKVNMLNERINQKFWKAKFKLFDKQINGGINEVCEVTYNGIPYKDLNNAMRINIGLDVINTISAYYGITAPIMIDNAESVNAVFPTEAQQIRFYVSHDRNLTLAEDE